MLTESIETIPSEKLKAGGTPALVSTESIETVRSEKQDLPLLLLPDPEPWPEPVDGQALLNELAGIFKRFVVLPTFAEEALALWTLHTYAFELRDVTA